MEIIKFDTLGLDPKILRAITEMGFEEPSPIQAKAIPEVMAGHDVIGQAQTGTGKTADVRVYTGKTTGNTGGHRSGRTGTQSGAGAFKQGRAAAAGISTA